MKAIISTTYSDTYLYFLPIVTWCWNKLGVDVICFMPVPNVSDMSKLLLISDTMGNKDMKFNGHYFSMPEHKQATAAQCSRLYGACLDLPEDEVLVTSDIDMGVINFPFAGEIVFGGLIKDRIIVFGGDLVPQGQVPMCYLIGSVKTWRSQFLLEGYTYQQKLDELLGDIECENMRGNYWSKDQQEANRAIVESQFDNINVNRAKEGTQFASHRYDRDDKFILDRLSPDTIDFHMPRPGYEDKNFEIILTILKYHYPDENFDWLISYNEEYKKLL